MEKRNDDLGGAPPFNADDPPERKSRPVQEGKHEGRVLEILQYFIVDYPNCSLALRLIFTFAA